MAFWVRLGVHNISVLSAAVVFYSFLSIFPAIAALVSLYGLVADTNDIVRQLNALQAILPGEATALISERLKALVQNTRPPFRRRADGECGYFDLECALRDWHAHDCLERDLRGPGGEGIGSLQCCCSVADRGVDCARRWGRDPDRGASLLLSYLPIPTGSQAAAMWIRWPLLVGIIIAIIALLYRYAPNRTEPRWDLVSAGGLLATTGLIAGSYAFSEYVSTFAAYQKTYGSLGRCRVHDVALGRGLFHIGGGRAQLRDREPVG